MAASQLTLYNGALLICGERALASLAENREPRRLLDQAWDGGAVTAVDYCLGAGQWKFAKRTVELVASTTLTPAFGYAKAFVIPSDHVRTTALCADEYQKVPLTDYAQERGYWFADADPLYVSYVSNHADYGSDMALWPTEFIEFVETYLARKVVHKLTQDAKEWERVYMLAKKCRTEAASSDAMEGPTAFPPSGAWVAARRGRGGANRGNRNSLIG